MFRGIDGSQWSLTFEVRKSWVMPFQMAPKNASQWSLTFEVGKSRAVITSSTKPHRSQWSLTFEVRKSRPLEVDAGSDAGVAMEPDL